MIHTVLLALQLPYGSLALVQVARQPLHRLLLDRQIDAHAAQRGHQVRIVAGRIVHVRRTAVRLAARPRNLAGRRALAGAGDARDAAVRLGGRVARGRDGVVLGHVHRLRGLRAGDLVVAVQVGGDLLVQPGVDLLQAVVDKWLIE